MGGVEEEEKKEEEEGEWAVGFGLWAEKKKWKKSDKKGLTS